MSKPSGRCIFCGGGKLSKEHIFPEWIQPILGKKFSHTTHKATRGPIYRDAMSHAKQRQGDPLTRKLYVVCRDCNNGWMSRLQNEAKSVLRPLLLRDWSGLTPERLRTLATWVTMTDIVMEYADHSSVTMSEADRAVFRSAGLPPAHWQIWMACFDDLHDRNFLHTAICLKSEDLDTGQKTEEDFHINTICIGGVAFLVLDIPESLGIECNRAFMASNGYVKIWPPEVKMPSMAMSISMDVARGVHEALFRGLCPDGGDLPPLDPAIFAE